METLDTAECETEEIAPGVHVTPLVAGERMSLQRFHIEAGARVPEHSHPHEQVGFLYEGALAFLAGDTEHVVGAGESFALAGGEPHAAENRGDVAARGVDVFSPPREGFPE